MLVYKESHKPYWMFCSLDIIAYLYINFNLLAILGNRFLFLLEHNVTKYNEIKWEVSTLGHPLPKQICMSFNTQLLVNHNHYSMILLHDNSICNSYIDMEI